MGIVALGLQVTELYAAAKFRFCCPSPVSVAK